MTQLSRVTVVVLLFATMVSWAENLDEDFVWRKDRKEFLASMRPSQKGYYWYHILDALANGKIAEAEEFLVGWKYKYGVDKEDLKQARLRVALKLYETDPNRALEILRDELKVKIDHQPTIKPEDLPSMLTAVPVPEIQDDSYAGLRGERLLEAEKDHLTMTQLTALLENKFAMNLPSILDLVEKRLTSEVIDGDIRSFHCLPMRNRLSFQQLEELLKRIPGLLQAKEFVAAYVTKHPSTVRGERTKELQDFLVRGGSIMNELRMGQALHALNTGVLNNEYDAQVLGAYFEADAARNENKEGAELREILCRSGNGKLVGRGLPQDIVDNYIEGLLATVDELDGLKDQLDWGWLSRYGKHEIEDRWARSKLLRGIDAPKRWFKILGESKTQKIRDLQVFELVGDNLDRFGVQGLVKLRVTMKNVDNYLIKIYPLDMEQCLQERGEIQADKIQLTGFAPAHDRLVKRDESPYLRNSVELSFPEIQGRGAWVIELVAGRSACRALIRKGDLFARFSSDEQGMVCRVLDETGNPALSMCRLKLGSDEYHADKAGVIRFPFLPAGSKRKAVLTDGHIAKEVTFQHLAAAHELVGDIHIPRETVLRGKSAKVFLRIIPMLNNHVLHISELQNPRLKIQSVTAKGEQTSVTNDVSFSGETIAVSMFSVCAELEAVEAEFSAYMPLADGKRKRLSMIRRFTFNENEGTSRTAGLLLSETTKGRVLSMLGKNGEPQGGEVIDISFECHDVPSRRQNIQLRTDAAGQVYLGRLEGVSKLAAQNLATGKKVWDLKAFSGTLPGRIQMHEGESCDLPMTCPAFNRGWVMLQRQDKRGWIDHFSNLSMHGDSILRLTGLSAGDYTLCLGDEVIDIEVLAGVLRDGTVHTENGVAENLPFRGLGIDAKVEDEKLRINITNAGPETRIHWLSEYFDGGMPSDDMLWAQPISSPWKLGSLLPISTYLSNRPVDPETDYIYTRKYAPKFAGNMLPQPSMLLTPIPMEEEDDELHFRGPLGGRSGGGRRGICRKYGGAKRSKSAEDGDQKPWCYDFLADSADIGTNLKLDAQGHLDLSLSDFNGRQAVIVMVTDGSRAAWRRIGVGELQVATVDRRYKSVLSENKTLCPTVKDFAAEGVKRKGSVTDSFGRKKLFTSIASIWPYLSSVGVGWTDFSFLLNWESLTDEQKQLHYTERCCHELNFFLYHKDRTFFNRVVQPFLRNKLQKDFLDQYLLGEDLSQFLLPPGMSSLSAIERILLGQRHPAIRRAIESQLIDSREEFSRLAILDPDFMDNAYLRRKMIMGNHFEILEEMEVYEQVLLEEIEEIEEDLTGEDRIVRCRPNERWPDRRGSFKMPGDTWKWYDQGYHEEAWNYSDIEKQDSLFAQARFFCVNDFWLEYLHSDGSNFLSPYFYCSLSFREGMFMLAVLDLPIRSESEEGDALIFQQGLLPARTPIMNGELVVKQRYRRHTDSARKFMDAEEEFDVGVVYTCELLIANAGQSAIPVDLFYEIPAGAIPVLHSSTAVIDSVSIPAENREIFTYHFYFPEPGDFSHSGALPAQEGSLVAATYRHVCRVRESRRLSPVERWQTIAREGTLDEVISFMETHDDLDQQALSHVAWRMKDRDAYDEITQLLSRQFRAPTELLGYSLFHRDTNGARGLLKRCNEIEGPILSKLLTRVPVADNGRQWHDFWPVIYSRAHQTPLIRETKIALQEAYDDYIRDLVTWPGLRAKDRLLLAHYLFALNRIGDALAMFDSIQARVEHEIQYDYLKAYVHFFRNEIDEAQKVAAKYKDYPITTWRSMFIEVLAQVEEAKNGVHNLDGTNTDPALLSPSLKVEQVETGISVAANNIPKISVRFHDVNIEELFSNQPFMTGKAEHNRPVRPIESLVISPKDDGETVVEIPNTIAERCLLIEVVGGGMRQSVLRLGKGMKVTAFERFGQVFVQDEQGRPVVGAYVKVYQRGESQTSVSFYKDGYTDPRGRFDYVSLNTDRLDLIEKFAILVVKPGMGATVLECSTPKIRSCETPDSSDGNMDHVTQQNRPRSSVPGKEKKAKKKGENRRKPAMEEKW